MKLFNELSKIFSNPIKEDNYVQVTITFKDAQQATYIMKESELVILLHSNIHNIQSIYEIEL